MEPLRSFSKSLELIAVDLRRTFLPLRSASASSPLSTDSKLQDGFAERAGGDWVPNGSLPKTLVVGDEGFDMMGMDGVSLELTLDLRRLRRSARLKRLAVVCEPELTSESVLLDELESSEEVDGLSNTRDKTPG